MSSLNFSSFLAIGPQIPLNATSEQKTFFSEFLGRLLEVLTFTDARLFESYHELFKGALGQMEKEEQEFNRQHIALLKKLEGRVESPDLLTRQQNTLKILWQQRRLV